MAFDSITGHETVKKFIIKEFEQDRIPNAFLFHGPRGVGKFKTAVELSKLLNCTGGPVKPCGTCFSCRAIENSEFPDVTLIDPLVNIKRSSEEGRKTESLRDTIDDVISASVFKPNIGEKKIVIIDDVADLSVASLNNLLKLLEEPPAYMCLILITEEIGRILPTIQSRCQKITFKKLAPEELTRLIQISELPNDPIIAELSEGSIGRYKELSEGAFERYMGIIDKLSDTFEKKGSGVQDVIDSATSIEQMFSKETREYFRTAADFFDFLRTVMHKMLIEKNIHEKFKKFYFAISSANKTKQKNVNEDLELRVRIMTLSSVVIDDAVKACRRYVNFELLLSRFVLNFGKSIRGID